MSHHSSCELTNHYSPVGFYDLAGTLSMLALGHGDPCLRIDGSHNVRFSILGPHGPIAITVTRDSDQVHAKVVGTDAAWVEPYVPSMLGLDYQPPQLDGPRRLRWLAHQNAGLRLVRSPVIFSRLVQIVLQQLVSFRDACHGWRELVRRHGTTIPGHDGLMAPPTADVLARMATFEFVECGILPEHGRRIIGLARVAKRIEATWDAGSLPDSIDRTCQLLVRQRGVGPWTVGYLRGSAMGDDDAIVLGDYGFPKRVAYFFDGTEQADDDDMVRRLDPYRPHRFYLLTLILKGGPHPPRRGPRRSPLRHRLRRR